MKHLVRLTCETADLLLDREEGVLAEAEVCGRAKCKARLVCERIVCGVGLSADSTHPVILVVLTA